MICAHDPGTSHEAIEMNCPCCGQSLIIDSFKTVHSEPVCAGFVVMPAHEFIEKCASILRTVIRSN